VPQVVDPSSGEMITVDEAIQKGIFDPSKGKYFNMKTGELLSVKDAVKRNLMLTSDCPVSHTLLLCLQPFVSLHCHIQVRRYYFPFLRCNGVVGISRYFYGVINEDSKGACELMPGN